MKLRAITPASVSLQLGPLVEPGRDVDFGDELPAALLAEIDQNVKAGLLAIVKDEPPPSVPPAPPLPEKKKGR